MEEIMRLISVNGIKELEKKADESGFTYAEMMQVAGKGIAAYLDQRYKANGFETALGLLGKGNNGGDTIIALTNLQRAGWRTMAHLAVDRGNNDALLEEYQACGGRIIEVQDLPAIHQKALGKGLVLDGVFGTGFRVPLARDIADLLSRTRALLPDFKWIAVDCPSGVDCETGDVSEGTIKADITLCLQAVKTGLLSYNAFPYCGEVATINLGLSKYDEAKEYEQDMVIDDQFVRSMLPQRQPVSHKGSFGKVMVIGGSVNYTGAPVLSGMGAYAVGTGLVQVAVPESIRAISLQSGLELTWLLLEDAGGVISEQAGDTILENFPKVQCVVLGPGIGRDQSTGKFVAGLLIKEDRSRQVSAGFPGMGVVNSRKAVSGMIPPMVVDADTLFHLSRIKDWHEKVKTDLVLTPHPGEMALLTGLPIDEIQSDRAGIARKYAMLWKTVLVLKGALTVVADPEGSVSVVPVATASLAKAGTGDVLAGMIGGLVAQGLMPYHAAVAGSYLHARAGLKAEERIGCSESVLAGDVVGAIPLVYRDLKRNDLLS